MEIDIKQFSLSVQDIEAMDGTYSITIPESDYGLAEIYFDDGTYTVYEIPMYGGDPRIGLTTESPSVVVETIRSWT